MSFIKQEYNSKAFIYINIDNFQVALCTLGASIYFIKCGDDYMTHSPSNFDDYMKTEFYHGKTIGRLVNRYPGNVVVIDNKKYVIDNNDGANTLHGGTNGLSTTTFDYSIKEKDNCVEVLFSRLSKSGESGLPGDIYLEVKYTIKKNIIQVDYLGVSDTKTPLSLTNHSYFCVGEDSIYSLDMKINSSQYLDIDQDNFLPLNIKTCEDYMDFSNFKNVSKDIDVPELINGRIKGYGQYFIFDKIDINIPQISVRGSKHQMDIYTSFEGTTIYTDNYEDDFAFLNTTKKVRRGIAIEPSDCFQKLHFVEPNQKYINFIRYEFKNI